MPPKNPKSLKKKVIPSKDVLKFVARMLPERISVYERIVDPGIRVLGLRGHLNHKYDKKRKEPFDIYPFVSFGMMVDVEEKDIRKATEDFLDTFHKQEEEFSKAPTITVNSKKDV